MLRAIVARYLSDAGDDYFRYGPSYLNQAAFAAVPDVSQERQFKAIDLLRQDGLIDAELGPHGFTGPIRAPTPDALRLIGEWPSAESELNRLEKSSSR